MNAITDQLLTEIKLKSRGYWIPTFSYNAYKDEYEELYRTRKIDFCAGIPQWETPANRVMVRSG